MPCQSTQKKTSCNHWLRSFAMVWMAVLSASARAKDLPLLVLDPHINLSPSHRRNALDSHGGASLSVQVNAPNGRTRPQSYGFTANMPFIRDPSNVQSGWGLGLGAFVAKAHSSAFLQSYDAQAFEISIGRSTIVPSLAESAGLQGFFEAGLTMASVDLDSSPSPSPVSVPSPRRSLFLRLGAMSLRGGQGVVTYKPYKVDQSFVSEFSFPIDFGETVLAFSHTAQIECLWAQLKCGTAFSYTRYSETISVGSFDEPSQWIAYGLSTSMYFFNRGTIVRLRVLWDAIKTSNDRWNNGSGFPSINGDLALVF